MTRLCCHKRWGAVWHMNNRQQRVDVAGRHIWYSDGRSQWCMTLSGCCRSHTFHCLSDPTSFDTCQPQRLRNNKQKWQRKWQGELILHIWNVAKYCKERWSPIYNHQWNITCSRCCSRHQIRSCSKGVRQRSHDSRCFRTRLSRVRLTMMAKTLLD